MAEKTEGLVYRKRPLRRVGKMIYYGSMADSHIILMQIKETKMEQLHLGAGVQIGDGGGFGGGLAAQAQGVGVYGSRLSLSGEVTGWQKRRRAWSIASAPCAAWAK